MEVLHRTPFSAGLLPILDKDGSEARVAVVKATYSIHDGGSLSVAEQQEPVKLTDVYLGDAGTSSVVMESDGAWFKPATDVVVIGSAFAPRGGATAFHATIECGPLSKTIAVFGSRRWSYTPLTGAQMSDPEPVAEVPLCWERCFGGSDPNGGVGTWEPRNPIGTGLCATKSVATLDGLPLPNFENPAQLIRKWNDRPAPHGLGFVGRSWQPRIRYAGTYDEAWQNARMPIAPLDFDYRFFNGAAAGLIAESYLQGGEMVRATNLSARGLEAFTLPSLQVMFRGTAQRAPFEIPGRPDTLVLDFGKMRMIVVYRAKYRVLQNESAGSRPARLSRKQSDAGQCLCECPGDGSAQGKHGNSQHPTRRMQDTQPGRTYPDAVP